MGAALIPIATQVVPFIVPLIAKLMEKIFGDKSGPIKFDTGTTILQTLFTSLQKALAGSGISLPVDLKEIQTLLQSTVDQLNKIGQLKGSATVIDPVAVTQARAGNTDLVIKLLDAATGLLKT